MLMTMRHCLAVAVVHRWCIDTQKPPQSVEESRSLYLFV